MIVDVPKMLACLGIREYDRKRTELWAGCPMPGHVEGKASWSIVDDRTSPKHGLHKCFGCKRSGGPVQLVAIIVGITNRGAYRWLIDNGCIVDETTPDTLPAEVHCRVEEPWTTKLTLPHGVVCDRKWRELPTPVRRYLARRGITAWQVEHYRIGYAMFGKQEGRIVFPAINQYGRLLSWTGRSFDGSDLRYLSAKEEPGVWPDAALFGPVMWERKPIEECYGAEGAIKALAVERAMCSVGTGERGPAIVAFSGSELHEEQVLALRRFERITYVADPNEAGQRFAAELEDKLCGMSAVRVVTTPDGTDADQLPRRELRALLG